MQAYFPKAYFLDTSALFKRYRREEGSAAVEALFSRQAVRFISEITLLEVVSNLRRLVDVDKIVAPEEFDTLRATFLKDIAEENLEVVRLTGTIIVKSLAIASQRYITPIDAVQLATAASMAEPPVFVCADQKLLRLAAEEGLEVLDVSRDVPAEK
ncbi:MAG: type II toxin-antitoxin system VapC family toxin [Bacillota bacterium]|nr:type II toxin-antitoxin system VapC family toxin [Bacillota bacterium]